MDKNSKVYVAGHTGLVGSAIERRLRAEGFRNLLVRRHAEVDLTDAQAVRGLLQRERPDYVFMAAARVGGIWANSTYPAQFIRDNLAIATNVIEEAYRAGVKKLLFLGSSCIYPRNAPQPMKESYLLSGELEPTNEAYAIAKIAGIKMCQAYRAQYAFDAISVMPTNLYGPNDNFDLKTSHVLPALIRKFHEAKLAKAPNVAVWGTGNVRREFLHVDDVADACVLLMERYSSPEIINIGLGDDITIRELAVAIKDVTGYGGEIRFDPSKPDGMPRKWLDVSRLHALGWKARVGLREGLRMTYDWYVKNESGAARRAPPPGAVA